MFPNALETHLHSQRIFLWNPCCDKLFIFVYWHGTFISLIDCVESLFIYFHKTIKSLYINQERFSFYESVYINLRIRHCLPKQIAEQWSRCGTLSLNRLVKFNPTSDNFRSRSQAAIFSYMYIYITSSVINGKFSCNVYIFWQIALSGAVNGPAMYYGKLDPYVTEVILHEHCYIRGPNGCHGEAIQLYSKISKSFIYICRFVSILWW